VNEYESKKYSQFGEDGITLEILKRVYDGDITNKRYVEFGVYDGQECNTRILKDDYNWSGLMMDIDFSRPSINLQRERVTAENVLELFEKYSVPSSFELLSVDIDGNDFYVINKILEKHKVDVIVCEYNGSHLVDVDAMVEYDPDFLHDDSNYYGASLLAMKNLMNHHGYSLVAATSQGVNAFFVNDNILKEKNNLEIKNVNDIYSIYRKPTYGNGVNGGHDKDQKNRKFVTSNEVIKA
tara:strand:- start:109 stop:825 length:717 start_codon:yes stop_codon:yes gene_type:complete